jgi:hypothetical protein
MADRNILTEANMKGIRLAVQAVAVGTPDAGFTAMFVLADGMYVIDSSGVVSGPFVGASVIDAKGDLLVGTAANTIARLPAGTNGQVLSADSTQAAGVKWQDPTDSKIDAKGDLLVGTAADTLGKLGVGTDNQVLTADAAQTTGMKWADPITSLADITQTEIDFGSTPTHCKSFTVTDASVTVSTHIVASVAYVAATSKSADEAEMDPIMLICQPGSGQFTVHATAMQGRVAGAFKINYIVGA